MELPVVNFAKVENDQFPQLNEDVASDLGHDQAYLYDMSGAIQVGEVPEKLALQQPGPLNHARWLTLANRILRLYIATKKPSKSFKRLVFIIIQFYAPSWFFIKSHPSAKDGPRNLLQMIHFSRALAPIEQEVAQKVIQRNGFFAHPENILRSMLADEDKGYREKAVNKKESNKKNLKKLSLMKSLNRQKMRKVMMMMMMMMVLMAMSHSNLIFLSRNPSIHQVSENSLFQPLILMLKVILTLSFGKRLTFLSLLLHCPCLMKTS